jgi:hypothetical protein
MFVSTSMRRAVALVALICLLAGSVLPVRAQGGAAILEGIVDDAATGLPLAGAAVSLANGAAHTVTDAAGHFRLDGLSPAVYRLRIEHAGYQSEVSAEIPLVAGADVQVTLVAQQAAAARTLQAIGSTATGTRALQRASTMTTSLTVDALDEDGVTRAGDALRELPAITNSVKGNTAALGDDIPLEIRGIGALETATALDGHPIALGFPGGYNFQLSPVGALRGILVTYGSGSNLFGTSAIGGIIDFQTLLPTPDQRLSLEQGWGTFDKTQTTLRASGTEGRLSYAFAYGVAGLDGPIDHQRFYQAGTAYDPSATSPAVRDLAVYDDDSSANAHTGLAKLRYELDPGQSITLTSVLSSYYADKTGNGDGDYFPYAPALAFGKQLLAKYNPATAPVACPAGSFYVKGAGAGPNGQPDGGSPCQTPQQYAAFNTGWDGDGPAYQTFDFADEHVGYDLSRGNGTLHVDAFTDRYDNTVVRDPLLYLGNSWSNKLEDENGASIVYDLTTGRANTVGVGYTYINLVYRLASETQTTTSTTTALGAPIVHEDGLVLHDTYRVPGSPLSAFGDAYLRHASATDTTSLDPRASLVYDLTRHDIVRVSSGATTTGPAGNQLGQPFVPALLGGAGGGSAISCGSLNVIGSAPSSVLHPERGVDEEAAYGHSYGLDSQVELTAYNVNVFDKLYALSLPLSETGTSFINPAFLAAQEAAVSAKCGSSAAPGLLGLSGTFNIGELRARGTELTGRHRFDRRTFFDYAWTTDSTGIVSLPASYLRSNLTLVPGAQIPRVPLHTLDGALDHTFGPVDVRYTYHWISDNNTKALPAYDYSDLRIAVPLGPGEFSIAIDNLLNQDAFIEGLRYEGVPLALNSYATPSSYAQYTGAAATELFGLPYRSIFFTYALRVR